jgi:hypothetical protein
MTIASIREKPPFFNQYIPWVATAKFVTKSGQEPQIWPDTFILGHFSGNLTSAQRFTTRDHYLVGAARGSRRWIRLASFRTEVKDVVPLLVNARRPSLARGSPRTLGKRCIGRRYGDRSAPL